MYIILLVASILACFINYRLGYQRATRRAAHIASMYTMGPKRSLYPGVSWEETSEAAKHIAHSTAQTIAELIRYPELNTTLEDAQP
jgi:hypothetical protein